MPALYLGVRRLSWPLLYVIFVASKYVFHAGKHQTLQSSSESSSLKGFERKKIVLEIRPDILDLKKKLDLGGQWSRIMSAMVHFWVMN